MNALSHWPLFSSTVQEDPQSFVLITEDNFTWEIWIWLKKFWALFTTMNEGESDQRSCDILKQITFTYPYLKFDTLVVSKDSFHFEINTNSWDESWRERIVSITKQKTSFSNTRVANDKKLKHVVKVLVCCIFLPFWVTSTSHLKVSRERNINKFTILLLFWWESLPWKK